jgi:PQQ-dependent catabolism-associated CXXCW motif protein
MGAFAAAFAAVAFFAASASLVAVAATPTAAADAAALRPRSAGAATPAAVGTEPADYWTGDADAPVPPTLRGGTVIHVKRLAALLKKGGVVVVDVSNAPRKPPDMAPGAPWIPLPHPALPGASWIPGAGAGAISPDIDAFYRERLEQAAGVRGLDAPVIIYCHKACWLSWNAAKRAIGYGYRRVYWFPDGVEGWAATGHATVVAAPQEPPASGASSAAQGPVSARAVAMPAGDAPTSRDPGTSPSPKLVVLDLELTGDLGGPEFTAEHDARLKTESARLRQDLERTQLYTVLDNAPAQGTIDRLKSQQAYLHDCNGCDLEVGRQLNADMVMVAWVNRVSGLILTLTYEIHDVKTGQIAARKSYDFRGDSDNAWNHAIDYMVRDIKATAGASTTRDLRARPQGVSAKTDTLFHQYPAR